MDHTQREIRDEIEATRAGMVEKIAALEGRMDETIRDVKRSFSVGYQTERRPWLMIGLSVAAGYLVSGFALGRPAPRAKVVLPKDWPPRYRSPQGAGITQSLIGMVSGVVTATAVALARDYASRFFFKQQDHRNGHDSTPGQTDRRFQ